MTEDESSDIIGGKTKEGTCVCGKQMRKISVHLNYVVWKCEFCGRKDTRMKGARPFELDITGEQGAAESSILDDIVTVTEKRRKKDK